MDNRERTVLGFSFAFFVCFDKGHGSCHSGKCCVLVRILTIGMGPTFKGAIYDVLRLAKQGLKFIMQ